MFKISQIERLLPWILWGGDSPSGSLKYLTYKNYFAANRDAILKSPGLVEVSSGSTALALDAIAREVGLACCAVTDIEGSKHLKSQGFEGETWIAGSLGEAMDLCTARTESGWHCPRQFENTSLIQNVELWAIKLKTQIEQHHPSIERLFVGLGTGATVAGLSCVFENSPIEVIACECPSPTAPIQGWRHYATQNFGERDVYQPYNGKIRRISPHPHEGRSAFKNLLLCAENFAPSTSLVVSHDGKMKS